MSTTCGFDTVLSAFLEGKRRTVKNDCSSGEGGTLIYHSSAIAWIDEDGSLMVSLCGYDTMTTRMRVNKVLAAVGSDQRFQRIDCELYFGGVKADAYDKVRACGPLTMRALRAWREPYLDRAA